MRRDVQCELLLVGNLRTKRIHNADVPAEIKGIIKAIHVAEGDVIKKGTVIAHLSYRNHQAYIKKLDA